MGQDVTQEGGEGPLSLPRRGLLGLSEVTSAGALRGLQANPVINSVSLTNYGHVSVLLIKTLLVKQIIDER